MMTLQARESFSPINYPGRPLRAYPVDSPRAKARLIVLALLADGRVDASELDGLAKYRAFEELGITPVKMSSAEFAAFVAKQINDWAPAIKAADLKP